MGGGLFPRTALILRELLPAAHLTIVDSNPRNLETARVFLGGNIEYRNERYVHGGSLDCDLTVIPLCLDGDRAAIYRHPPSSSVLVHDWIWRRRGSRYDRFRRAAEASQPGAAMRGASLLLVFLLAKLVVVWGHAAPLTVWSLVAYVWQDAMVALAFAAFDIACERIGRDASNCLGDLLGCCRSTRRSTYRWGAWFPLH